MSKASLDFAKHLLQSEAIRQAASEVVDEWVAGNIIAKEGYSNCLLPIACLRDVLNGYIPEDVLKEVK